VAAGSSELRDSRRALRSSEDTNDASEMVGGAMASPMAVSCGTEAKNLPNGKLVVLGRFLFALIFLFGGASHFSKQTIAYAASQGVPFASIAVPLSGIFAIAGGLSILLGYRAKVGAGLVMLFLIRTILIMDRFWAMHDPLMARMHMALFMENVALIGGALFISQFGAGPFSIDALRAR
jgi:putative oxidoreductase